MKRYPGMNIMRGMLLASVLMAAACGGEQSVASKSAAAYREAQAKGIPVGGGHEHGGDAATETTGSMDHSAHGATATGGAPMDHSAHGTTADAHAGMNHGTAAAGGAVDHAAMGHGTTATGGAVDHAAMGHGTAARSGAVDHAAMGHGAPARTGAVDHAAMGHGTPARTGAVDHAAMGHGAPARTGAADHAAMGHGTPASAQPRQGGTAGAVDHSQHAGMQQPAASAAADPHAQHGAPQPSTASADHSQHGSMPMPAAAGANAHAQHGTSATAGAPIAAAPRSNAEMQRVRPSATLQRDAFDAPAPVSVSEAAKAGQGGGHEGHGTRGITPGQDRENPPTPMPATRDGGSARPAATDHSQHGGTAAATTYTCPMHPEVTSDKPGTCPKCGMALVKKN